MKTWQHTNIIHLPMFQICIHNTAHIKKIFKSLGIVLVLSHVFLRETSSILNGHPVLWQPTECTQTLVLLFMKFQSTSHSDKLIPQA